MPEPLTPNDWSLVGAYIRDELERRRSSADRIDRERIWREIDRQIAMKARKREVLSGDQKDWYPNLELPLQFNALEVISADARRLKFPRGPEWFSVMANVSDKYIERFQERRDTKKLLSGIEDAQQIVLDQETADVLIKATIDYYHRRS